MNFAQINADIKKRQRVCSVNLPQRYPRLGTRNLAFVLFDMSVKLRFDFIITLKPCRTYARVIAQKARSSTVYTLALFTSTSRRPVINILMP